MAVTQVLMGPGSWSLTLDEATLPPDIRDAIQLLDHIVICRNKLDDGASDAAKLAAVDALDGYVGVVLTKDSTTFGGQDLSWWLDFRKAAAVTKASSSASTWLDSFLPINGIAKGSVSGGTSFAGTTTPEQTVLAHVNWVAENADMEWQIRPDLTLDMKERDTLFPNPSLTSATIVTRKGGGDEAGFKGVDVSDTTVARDASSIVSKVIVGYDDGGPQFVSASQTPAGVRWKDPAGSTPADRAEYYVGLDVNSTQASAVATRRISYLSTDHKEVSLSSATHNVTAGRILPGAKVWCYDKAQGLYDTANQATYGGEVIWPIKMRVASLTWPITSGMGVYARLDGGATWYDLSPYLVVEDGADVQWAVSVNGFRRNAKRIKTSTLVIDDGKSAKRGQRTADFTTTSGKIGKLGTAARVWTQSGEYSPFPAGGLTTSATTDQAMYAAVADFASAITIDRICCEVVTTAGSAGSVIRMGVYADDGTGNNVGALVADFGTVGTTTTGVKEITVSQALTPGRYWFVVVPQGAPATSPTIRVTTGPSVLLPQGSTTPTNLTGVLPRISTTASGSLPSSVTMDTTGRALAPRLAIRVT